MWAALVPDGELSSFERRLLEVHLTRCTSCREHADRLTAITTTIRGAGDEPLHTPVVVLGRRRQWGQTGRVAAAASASLALAVLALGVGTRVGDGPPSPGPQAPLIIAPVLAANEAIDTFRGGQALRTVQAHRAVGLTSPQIEP